MQNNILILSFAIVFHSHPPISFITMKGSIIFIQFILAISQIAPVAYGYKTGAPTVACDSLLPNHGVPPQTSPSPYKIVVERVQTYASAPLEITLTSKNGKDEFKGFLIQVRGDNPEGADAEFYNKPLGEFENNTRLKDARVLPCNGVHNLAMTHKGPEPKKSVTVRWIPEKVYGFVRIHVTFLKDYSTFWNQHDDQVIEVAHPGVPFLGLPKNQHDKLCLSMKLNESVEYESESSNPYKMMVGPVMGLPEGKDSQTIGQNETMWINVTSEYDTPILMIFLQVRPLKSKDVKSVGRFLPKVFSDYKNFPDKKHTHAFQLLNCFGGQENAMLLENRMHNTKKISDISVQWMAPQDQVGDYEIFATALSEEDVFWAQIGDDPQARKIKVVKKSGASGGGNGGLQLTVSKNSVSITGGYPFKFYISTFLFVIFLCCALD